MAEVRIRRSIEIKAETVGDVTKWLRTVEGEPMSTPLLEPVELAVHVDEDSGAEQAATPGR